MNDMIHIAVSLHDRDGNDAQHLGACLCSIFLNTAHPVTVHLMHDETLTIDNKVRFDTLAQASNRVLRYYDVSRYLASTGLPEQPVASVSPAELGRLFLPDLLPDVQRCICLDAEMIVDMDIAELWSYDLKGAPLGAVPDLGIQRALYVVSRDPSCDAWASGALKRWRELAIPLDRYFNSGTLLVDLEQVRTQGLFAPVLDYGISNAPLPSPVQDALNVVFQRTYAELPFRFNVMLSLYPTWSAGPCIWHFTGQKPWEHTTTPRRERYLHYVSLSPWRPVPKPHELRLGETSKSISRRIRDPRFVSTWLRGDGIDIGCGEDSIGAYSVAFPLMKSVRGWDLADGDAQYMRGVPDGVYDFVHSSHCLEHLRDPLEALRNWMRILKPGGHLVIMIPDEDLYEQGVFPSVFNLEHLWTFTLYKDASWSGRSLNLFALLAQLGERADVRKIELLDHLYHYDHPFGDQLLHREVEAGIEFVVRKRTDEEIYRKGRLPVMTRRPRSGTIMLHSNGRSVALRDIRNEDF